MKKYLLIILSVMLCFMTACSNKNNGDNGQVDNIHVTKNQNLNDGKSEEQTFPEDVQIIISEKYYKVGRKNFDFYYHVYSSDGKVVLSGQTDRPLDICMSDNNIVNVSIGMGTGLVSQQYYSIDRDRVSNTYYYVAAYLGECIAYVDGDTLENRVLKIENVFDKNEFYCEVPFDFALFDTPITKAEFSEDGKSLLVEYYSDINEDIKTRTISLIDT